MNSRQWGHSPPGHLGMVASPILTKNCAIILFEIWPDENIVSGVNSGPVDKSNDEKF
jgi:hypothetical protein